MCGRRIKQFAKIPKRVGPQVFVPLNHDEITIENLKEACMKQFKIAPSFECDTLRTERGPSCHSISQHPAKASFINVRFIKKSFETTKHLLGSPFNKSLPLNSK